MNSHLPAALSLAILLGVSGTAAGQADAAAAQTQPALSRDARAIEILEAAQAAIAEAKSMSITVDKGMERTDELAPEHAMFAAVSFGARGTVKAARDDEGDWMYLIDGKADDIGKPDAFTINILRESDKVSWLEHEDSQRIVALPSNARSRTIGTESEFGVRYLVGDRGRAPMADLAAAPGLRTLETESIDGVLCDVVLVEFDQNDRNQTHRVYVGANDNLPRRIVRVMVPGFEEHYRFTHDPEADVTPASLSLEAPAAWETVYRPIALDPDYRPQARFDQPKEVPTQATPENVGYIVGNTAPAFSGLTLLDESVSSEDYEGKPMMLVFWTSWMPNANQTVQYAIDKHKEFGDDLGVVTFSIRERNPDAAFNMQLDAGGDDIPMLVDARDAILKFGVLRAPTIILIDKEGVISYRAEEFSAETTAAEADEAIKAVLAGE